MAKLVFNRDGGKTDEFGHLLGLSRMLAGEVLDGLQVAANGVPNMSIVVGYGTGAVPTGSAGTAYKYFIGVDSNENVTIPTANGSNPRNDLIVAYVDKGVTPSTSFTNNSNAVLKIVVVSGTPAVTPADPSGATIQAAVGAGNPYIILARVLTGAGVTQINNGNITDLRSLAGMTRAIAGSIDTAALQALAVTTAKMADLAITTGKLADGSATTPKMKPTYTYVAGSTGGSRQSIGTSWTDVKGAVTSYTSGNTPEVLHIFGTCIANATAAGSTFLIGVNGVVQGKSDYDDQNGTFKGRFGHLLYNIPANTTVTIALMGKAASGTVVVGNAAADVANNYSPSLGIVAFGR